MKTATVIILALLTLGITTPAHADMIATPISSTTTGTQFGTFPSRYNWTPPKHTVKGECKRHGKHKHHGHKNHHRLCFVIN